MDRERNHIHRTHRAIWAAAAVWMGCGRAPEVWEREPDYYVQHDVLEHVHRSHTSRTFPFAEHPTGQLTMTTEARGLRADEDVAVPHPRDGRFRVVVTGDSHTDGVVHNHEHFKEALADTLSARRAQAGLPGPVEVVNGGHGHWGPEHYARFFAAYDTLEPDACLVVLYDGNDFLDALAWHERHGDRSLPRRPDHYERLAKVAEVVGEAVSQQLNQDALLAGHPDLSQQSLDLTLAALLRARDACAARPFAVAVLPSRHAVHAPSPTQSTAIATTLGLSPAERLSGRRLSRALMEGLSEAGVPATDTWPTLHLAAHGLPDKTPPQTMFWQTDHHLSVAGHAAVARHLDAELGDALAGLPVLRSVE